jgi:hypothetical protein
MTYPWSVQRDRRLPITQPPGTTLRMTTPSNGVVSSVQSMGNSAGGHVCHSPQRSTSSVCIPGPRSPGHGSRCAVPILGEPVDVHVSTISSTNSGNAETSGHSAGGVDTHSPLVAISSVFPTPTSFVWNIR